MFNRGSVFKLVVIMLILIMSTFTFTSCYGKFQMTRNLYKWNGTIGDKFINSVVMFVFLIIPVYPIVGFIDYAILNVIEFWSGKNPMAMGPDESETQLVEVDGQSYQITATQNRFDVIQVDTQTKVSLVFHVDENAWYAVSEKGEHKLAQLDQTNPSIVQLFQPDGQIIEVNSTSGHIIE